MRVLKIVSVLLVAALAVAGCGLFEETVDDKIQKALDEQGSFSVYLTEDVTAEQTAAVRARLEKLPDVTELVFEDKEAAHEKFTRLWASSSPEYINDLTPDSMPESFTVTTTSADVVREIRDGAVGDELETLPGVREILYICTTV
ncbi:MAG TPA: permease-like cell division protein FtsX, partial [Actinoplanes sp.]|nr:permease-like cell division protein FtsX [Actinoplanes sp.]